MASDATLRLCDSKVREKLVADLEQVRSRAHDLCVSAVVRLCDQYGYRFDTRFGPSFYYRSTSKLPDAIEHAGELWLELPWPEEFEEFMDWFYTLGLEFPEFGFDKNGLRQD